MRANPRGGLSVVEVVVVAVIVATIVAVAIAYFYTQRVQARRQDCLDNLKQIGLAMLHHDGAHGHFPTGGWGWRWAGDPDQGFDRDQPGGWAYNILPYMWQDPLHDMGRGESESDKRTSGAIAASIPLSVYICPSRRRSLPYPYVRQPGYYNIDRPSGCGRIDYAACAGDGNIPDPMPPGPESLKAGTTAEFNKASGKTASASSGISFQGSELPYLEVVDGLSNTYMVGEKSLAPECYTTGTCEGDDQGWDVGFDTDVNRWVAAGPGADQVLLPVQDRGGLERPRSFGGPHPQGWNVAMCDGAVGTMSYATAPEVHRRLGNRHDGELVSPKLLR
jgi:type II secretory pathway pseudopilin PulG